MDAMKKTDTSCSLSLMFFAVVAATALLGTRSAEAACVDPTGADGCETTIQAGVDATPAGGTVEVRAGVYQETVSVDETKPGLFIIGEGPKKSRLRDGNNDGLNIGSDNVTVEGLAVEGMEGDGIDVDANGVAIRNVLIADVDGTGIDITGSNAVIEKVQIVATVDDGIDIFGASPIIRNVDIERTNDSCIDATSIDNAVIDRVNARLCGDYGFDLSGDDIRIERSIVDGASGEQCLVLNGNRGVVLSNTFRMCEGAVDFDGERPVFSKNTVEGSFNGSVVIECGADCSTARVEKNKISGIDDDGLSVRADEPGMIVSGNTITAMEGSGLRLLGTGITATKNKISGSGVSEDGGIDVFGSNHTLVGNQVSGQNGPGIEISGTDHILTKNKVLKGLADGFQIRATAENVTLTSNQAIANDGTGFEIETGAIATVLTSNKGLKNRTDLCDEGTDTTDGGKNKFGTTGVCAID